MTDYNNFRPGDWVCSCGAHNYASKNHCFKCYLSKEVATGGSMNAFPRAQAGAVQQQGMQQAGLGQMGQMGQMGAQGMGAMGQQGLGGMGQMGVPAQQLGQQGMGNNALLAQMGGLQSLMGAYGMMGMGMPSLPQTPANFRPGDWMCKCGNHNYSSKSVCGKCSTPKDQGDISNLGVLAGMGMGGMGGAALPPNVPNGFRQGDWICKCGNHNYAKRDTCGRCGGSKVDSDATHSQNRPQNFQVGDWMCVCGAHNYRSKAACHKCNVTKEQGCVTTGGDSTNPNFRSGDWMCKCGNHNYASRTSCKVCNLPKEQGMIEETRGRSRSPDRNGQVRDRSRSPIAATF